MPHTNRHGDDEEFVAKWQARYDLLCGIDLRIAAVGPALPAMMQRTLRGIRRDVRRELRALERLFPTFIRPKRPRFPMRPFTERSHA
ncbi:MAG: hypothetical protein JWM95_2417 [Gemmatimonadetes bacterium]|nr:hypothetical protein [Gemmatimonadota bacterium]